LWNYLRGGAGDGELLVKPKSDGGKDGVAPGCYHCLGFLLGNCFRWYPGNDSWHTFDRFPDRTLEVVAKKVPTCSLPVGGLLSSLSSVEEERMCARLP